jgi:hypothetical protein
MRIENSHNGLILSIPFGCIMSELFFQGKIVQRLQEEGLSSILDFSWGFRRWWCDEEAVFPPYHCVQNGAGVFMAVSSFSFSFFGFRSVELEVCFGSRSSDGDYGGFVLIFGAPMVVMVDTV